MKTFISHKKLNNELRNREGSLGLVPTMGSLHRGHISLIEKATANNTNVIVSIFINPTQFDENQDLRNYPKNLQNDLQLLQNFPNILVYIPEISDLYPKKIKAKDYDFGKLDKIMEGEFRPGHFNGVSTIVEKLFTIFYPDFAYFGEKDFQQVIIIKALVEQQELSTKIISCPTIRENDGLAMSSRNQLLKEGYRKNAAIIHNSLLEAKQLMKSMNPPQLEKTVAAKFFNAEGVDLEYFKVLTNDSLAERKKFNKAETYRAFIACRIGEVRLIDNIILT